MLRHRIRCACLVMAPRILSAYTFHAIREIKTEYPLQLDGYKLSNADSAAISATVDYSSRPIDHHSY
jgi:hypothetical protein